MSGARGALFLASPTRLHAWLEAELGPASLVGARPHLQSEGQEEMMAWGMQGTMHSAHCH